MREIRNGMGWDGTGGERGRQTEVSEVSEEVASREILFILGIEM